MSRIEQELDDQVTLIELGEAEKDQKVVAEAEAALRKLKAEVARRELEALLSGEADANDSYLEVHAGAGGTESQDWASRCCCACTRAGPSSTASRSTTSKRPQGEEAGIKSATIEVKGRNAYGWLKTENGVHRLVRISPFDSNARRHTSFASVNVYPVVDDRIKIDIKEVGRARRHDARRRRRRPARQQDRIGDPPHPHPDQHRRRLPERPLAAPQPRASLADAARQALSRPS